MGTGIEGTTWSEGDVCMCMCMCGILHFKSLPHTNDDTIMPLVTYTIICQKNALVSSLKEVLNIIGATHMCTGNADECFLSLPNIHNSVLRDHSSKPIIAMLLWLW